MELAVDCGDFDNYKFGLGGNYPAYDLSSTHAMGRDGLISRYSTRKIHHLFGLVGFDFPCFFSLSKAI